MVFGYWVYVIGMVGLVVVGVLVFGVCFYGLKLLLMCGWWVVVLVCCFGVDVCYGYFGLVCKVVV